MQVFWSCLLGGGCAAVDALLLYAVQRAAIRTPEKAQSLVWRVLAARYLLTFAVLAAGFISPLFDPLWVVLILLGQKAALVLWSVLPHKRRMQEHKS